MSTWDEISKSAWDAHRIARKLEIKRQSTALITTEKRLFSLTDMDKAMDLLINGRQSATGLSITPSSANSLVSYFAGKRLISETVAMLPLIEYRRLPRGKERATDRILYRLLHDEPNPEMDAFSFIESRMENAIGWGNAFAEIQWHPDGYPEALWPLNVDKMQVGRDQNTKELIYAYRLPDGQTVTLPSYRVWHLKGFSPDGIIGYDSVTLMRESIAMGLAMEEYGARFFGNGANPGGVLEHPNKLSTPSQDNLRKSWNEMHQGLTHQHRIAILEEGMTYKATSIPNDNAQFLESRKFQLNEIARLLHIPPHMLADLDRATFSNIEEMNQEYVTYTLTPWLKRWEQTCNRKLLLDFEKPVFFFEFLLNALLRGNSASRAAYFKERFYLGSMSPNDIREYENENPIEDDGADKYYVQQNMIPMELAGKIPKAPSPPDSNKIDETVDKLADRDKNNILKAFRRDPANFEIFVEDYFRDFPEYMKKELQKTEV
jgi:HK97 family phage portal protein